MAEVLTLSTHVTSQGCFVEGRGRGKGQGGVAPLVGEREPLFLLLTQVPQGMAAAAGAAGRAGRGRAARGFLRRGRRGKAS